MLLSLTTYERLLYLQPSGLVIDSTPLDALFGISTNATFLALSQASDITVPAWLIKPSGLAYRQAMAASSYPRGTISEIERLKNITKFASKHMGHSDLIFKSSSLHQQEQDFASSSFMAKAAYVQLSDPGIPAPEYDIPRHVYMRSRPQDAEARRAWEDLYELYRTRRMDVCGLNLEPMPVDPGGIGVQELSHHVI